MNVIEELSEYSRRCLLLQLLSGPKNVSELVESTGLKQPNVSNHLGRLRAKQVVRTSKIGRQVFYSLGSNEVEEAINSFVNATRGNPQDVDLHALARDFAKAAVHGSEVTCQEYLDQAIRAQHTILDIYEHLLGAAMAIVGTWYRVEAIDEGEEHMASEITVRMLTRAGHQFGPRKKSGFKAILGCAPNNRHVIGLRMVGDYIHQEGWQVIYTGPDTPYDAFLKAVVTHEPNLVLLGCSADDGLEETLEMLRRLSSLSDFEVKFKLGVGGSSVSTRYDEFLAAGADFAPYSLREFSEKLLPEIEAFSTVANAERKNQDSKSIAV